MPNALFGEALLALLSDQMAKALLAEEEIGAIAEMPVRNRSHMQVTDSPIAGMDREPFDSYSKFSAVADSTYDTTNTLENTKHDWSLVPSPSTITAASASPTTHLPQKHAWPELDTGTPLKKNDADTDAPPDMRQYRRNGQISESVLDRKLREYWHLHQTEVQTERESPSWSEIDVAKGAIETPVLPFEKPSLSATWPDMVAQRATRKTQQYINDHKNSRLSRRVVGQHSPNPSENVDIHNIFNFEVKGGRDDVSAGDLAEKLADILRDQALQHGIDIT